MIDWLKKNKFKIAIIILSVLLVIATASAIYHYYKTPSVVIQKEFVKAPEIPKVKNVKRVKVAAPKEITTIEKKEISEKLKLPSWFKDNTDEQAIATAEIPPYKGKTSAVAILNTKTGDGQIIAKQEPLSLFGLINEREIGIRAGYRVDVGGAAIDGVVYGRWDFLRIGNVNIGVYGEGSTRGEAKAQIGFGYKF